MNRLVKTIRNAMLIIGLVHHVTLFAQTDTTKTSVELSQQVINPTTLAWQLQLEEFAIFRTENADGFAQNFRIRGIIPLNKGLLLPFPQLIRVIGFVNTAPGGPTGLGDLILNQFFILMKKDSGSLVLAGT